MRDHPVLSDAINLVPGFIGMCLLIAGVGLPHLWFVLIGLALLLFAVIRAYGVWECWWH